MNDSKGHAAGDAMLCEAAAALRETFPDTDIFRTGGDEFVIILQDISKEDFYGKIDLLRTVSKKHANVEFAIGGFYDNDVHNLNTALQKADERMYADKAEFYKKASKP